jgi:hypothetical protein
MAKRYVATNLDPSMLKRVDDLRDKIGGRIGIPLSRSNVLRTIIRHGLDVLEMKENTKLAE